MVSFSVSAASGEFRVGFGGVPVYITNVTGGTLSFSGSSSLKGYFDGIGSCGSGSGCTSFSGYKAFYDFSFRYVPQEAGTHMVTIVGKPSSGIAYSQTVKINVASAFCVQPAASFTFTNMGGGNSDTAGYAPATVKFRNLDYETNAPGGYATYTRYTWDFGDGSSSSDPAPIHTFQKPGSYRVKLTATGGRTAACQSQTPTSTQTALINVLTPGAPSSGTFGSQTTTATVVTGGSTAQAGSPAGTQAITLTPTISNVPAATTGQMYQQNNNTTTGGNQGTGSQSFLDVLKNPYAIAGAAAIAGAIGLLVWKSRGGEESSF